MASAHAQPRVRRKGLGAMQKAIRLTVYIFLVIFTLTAVLTILGLGYLWFFAPDVTVLPHLGWLLGALIAEVIGVIVMMAKRGLSYMPDVRSNKDASATSAFMVEFLSNGSSATIVSNRLGWLAGATAVVDTMLTRASSGMRIEVITVQEIPNHIRDPLAAAGVKFYRTATDDIPEARFTLINADRTGAERLAIARGVHPDHEITVFDTNSGPQIIGMAKDIVRQSKASASAA